MLTPTNTSLVPRNGWSVELEGLGPIIRSDNFSEFMRQVIKRLESNGGTKHGWREEVLDLMCRQRPDIPSEDTGLPPSRAMTGDDVFRFLRAMWETKLSGAQPVSEELQNRRVEVCLRCPKLGFISCFSGCSSLSERLSEFAIGRTIRRHPEIHKQSCLACGCSAEVKTMWPIATLREIDEKHGTKPEYHPDCWILNETAEENA